MSECKFNTTGVYNGDLVITMLDGSKNRCHVLCERSFVDFIFGFANFLNHSEFINDKPDLNGFVYEIKCCVLDDEIEDGKGLRLLKFSEPFVFNAYNFAQYFFSHQSDFNAVDFAFDCQIGAAYTVNIVSGCYIAERQPRGSAVGGLPPSSTDEVPAPPCSPSSND